MGKRSCDGFTLIELMIVIAIIGILAAIAIPNFLSYRGKAYCNAAESDANQVEAFIAGYFSVPEHIDLPVQQSGSSYLGYRSSRKGGPGNQILVQGTADGTITIVVSDSSGRCPLPYRRKSNNWGDDSATFTKIMRMADTH